MILRIAYRNRAIDAAVVEFYSLQGIGCGHGIKVQAFPVVAVFGN